MWRGCEALESTQKRFEAHEAPVISRSRQQFTESMEYAERREKQKYVGLSGALGVRGSATEHIEYHGLCGVSRLS